MSSSKITTRKINYCTNCGKYGHINKKCLDSITSLGIIATMFDGIPLNVESFSKFLNKKYIDIDNYNISKIENITKLDLFKKNIKFLMIQRKHSLTYVDFIRGNYDINNIEPLKELFLYMAPFEIQNISKLDFDNLWNNLWDKTSKNKQFQKEYIKSKTNFTSLIDTGIINDLINIKPLYDSTEWGFPKGKRNLFEKNLDCALREFNEETTIENDNIYLINKINNIVEEYTSTNNVTYKHIYYFALADNSNEKLYDIKTDDNNEISNVAWFTWEEATHMIRGHYTDKIKVLNQSYFLFLNLYLDYIKNYKQNYIQL